MAGVDAQGALKIAGAMGRAGFVADPPCAAWNPIVMPRNAAVRRPRTERPHDQVRGFSPGAFQELTAPMDLPGGTGTGWTLGGTGWKCNPRVLEVTTFSKTALYCNSTFEVLVTAPVRGK